MKKNKALLALELYHEVIILRARSRHYIQAKIKEKKVNITNEMLEVLICLWQDDGINQQEIAYRTVKEKASMVYLLDNLVKRKLVRRVEDENDRRNKLIYLTDDGKALYGSLQPVALDMFKEATADLAVKDIEAATEVIRKLIAQMK